MNPEQFTRAKSWEERYRLLIQAGKLLAQPSPQELAQMQPVSGCEAGLWIKIEPAADHTFELHAYSEARIINGLLWLLEQAVNGKTAEQLAEFDLTAYFTRLHIAERLSSTRLNGLKQIEKMLHSLQEKP